jgi:FkbM family methyltransferase
MLRWLFWLYRKLFAKRVFYKFNLLVFNLGLRGMGIRNYETDSASGEVHFIKHHIPLIETGVIIDVGANVGNYSRKVRAANSKVKIYAFEPHPATYQKLLNNTAGMQIEAINSGVGSSSGILKLYDYAEDDGSSHASLYQEVIEKIHKSKATEHEVEVITLDEFAERDHVDRVSLLKIDTEGNELEVLKGFTKYLEAGKVDLIHFEFNEMNVVSRALFKDFMELLPDYDFFRMLPNELVLIEKYHPLYCEIFAYQNIVAKLKK